MNADVPLIVAICTLGLVSITSMVLRLRPDIIELLIAWRGGEIRHQTESHDLHVPQSADSEFTMMRPDLTLGVGPQAPSLAEQLLREEQRERGDFGSLNPNYRRGKAY